MKKIIIILIQLFFFNNSFAQNTADGFYQSALNKASAEKYQESIVDFNKAIELDGNVPAYYTDKIKATLALGDLSNAMSSVNLAIKKFPNDNSFKVAKGWICIESTEYELAIGIANDLKKAGSKDIELYAMSAVANQMFGNYANAVKDYSEALSISPDNETLLSARAESYSALEQYSLALKDYNTLISLQPQNVEYLIARAICKKSNKELNASMLDFNKALQIDNKNSVGYFERGRLKFVLGDERGAIDDYSKCISLDPNNSMAFCSRGLCKARIKDNNGSLLDFNKSISLDSKNATAFYFRGLFYIEMNNAKLGCADLSKAGELGYMEAYKVIKENCN